jgi:tryptophan halogenase
MSESQALKQFSKYLGVDGEKFSPRKIPMRIGYREKFWSSNCVAIGLAQGFVEPLEATSILVTDFAAQYLARNFPRSTADMPLLSKRYNQVLGYAWERVIDFVKMHYCLSDRSDSEFWIRNRDPETLSDMLRERLELWQHFYPKNLDFFSKFEIFDAENYLYVLYGMRYPTIAGKVPPEQLTQCAQITRDLRKQTEGLSRHLPDHRALLQKLVRA